MISTVDTRPLANLSVLVTRPQHQAQSFIAKIQELGGKPCHLPTIEIIYGKGNPVTWSDADLFIFTSANAVTGALHALSPVSHNNSESNRPHIAAIGQATAHALAEAGIKNVICPRQNGNSEALLQLLESAVTPGTKVIIVRGDSGRDALKIGLTKLGAHVQYQQVYERTLPDFSDAQATPGLLWQKCRAHIICISSDLGLENLIRLLPDNLHKQLFSTPLIVNSARCRNTARACGFSAAIGIASPPGDQGQIEQLTVFARTATPPAH